MEFITLIIIFWIPFVMIFIKDVLWNLHFWEIKEYRFGRFFSHLYWDRENENRKPFITYIKFLCFCLISTLLISPILAISGIALIYIISIFEVLSFSEKIISFDLKKVNLYKIRNIFILISISVFLSIVIASISIPFLLIDRIGSAPIDYMPSFLGSSTSAVYPDIYIYLGISTLIYLSLDLGSPIFLAFFVFITSPIGWLQNKYKAFKLQSLINRRPNIIKVAIIGSQGKTTIKNFADHLIREHYSVLNLQNTHSSISTLSDDIFASLKPTHKIILMAVEAYHPNELTKIFKTLKPNITVFSDLNTHNIEGFKTIKLLREEYSKALTFVSENAVMLYNSKNKYIKEIAKPFSGKKIDVNKLQDTLKIKHNRKHLEESLLTSINLALELGVDSKIILEKIHNTQIFEDLEHVQSDNNSLLLINNNEAGYKTLLSNLEYARKLQRKLKYNNLFLVTNGIHGLGKYKTRVYKELTDKINNKADFLITTDALLARYSLTNNHKTKIVKVRDESELIYRLRSFMDKNDIVLIEGKISHPVVETLRSQGL
jgi:UDP-N-acetylmuramyl pentapeptide synthase